MGVASFFKTKREDKFLNLLITQSGLAVEGLIMLEKFITQPDQNAVEALRKKEHEADEINRILVDELHKTFITPLDREDIFNISLHIDEMLDYALTTIEEMQLLEITEDDYLSQMVALNRKAAEEISLAIQRLKSNPRVAGDHARRAGRLENDVESLYRRAIADLFTKAKDFKPLMTMLKRREVYRHVSNMADQAKAAATAIGIVVMKLS